MVLVLDDEHLERLQCSRCRRYLSVFPVKNHSSRDVTCGRCSGIDDDKDESVRSFLYELVAGEYLFRCVNRYEGCKKLLRGDETDAHERECTGNVFPCPKCKDDVYRSVLELIWHYRFQHPSSYLKKNSFEVRPTSNDVMLYAQDDVMLYVQDDVIFFISIRHKLNALYLGAATLTEVNVTGAFTISRGALWEKSNVYSFNNNEYHVFNLNSVESTKVILNFEVSKSRLYDISIPSTSKGITAESVECVDQIHSNKKKSVASGSNEKTFKIKLTTEFETKLGYKLNDAGTALLNKIGHEIDLTCSNCKQLIRLPVYMCTKSKHRICHNCRIWCGICDTNAVVPASSDYLLNKISSHLKFLCKWNCGGYFDSDLRTHENACEFKIVKCPKCEFVLSSSDFVLMEIHLLDNHQILYYSEEYDVEQVKRCIEQATEGRFYFMFHDKCCYLKWETNVNDGSGYYDFNFGLLENEPNVKLCVIKSNSKLSDTIVSQVAVDSVNLYLPYVNFNYIT